MKLIIAALLWVNFASADVFYKTANTNGLKELTIEADLEIECKMALVDVQEKLKSIKKAHVANPCEASGKVQNLLKYYSSVILLN